MSCIVGQPDHSIFDAQLKVIAPDVWSSTVLQDCAALSFSITTSNEDRRECIIGTSRMPNFKDRERLRQRGLGRWKDNGYI